MNLWTIGAHEGDEHTNPKQQVLHDIGQYIHKKTQWEPIISGVAETRGFKPDSNKSIFWCRQCNKIYKWII